MASTINSLPFQGIDPAFVPAASPRNSANDAMSYTLADLSSMVDADDLGVLEAPRTPHRYTSRSISNSFEPIPLSDQFDQKTQRAIHRVNAFGSLYYFATVILRRNKMQVNPDRRANLHYQMCKVVEKDGIQDVIEIPRDHFKSTIFSEVLPMWRALAFTDEDEYLLRTIGGPYGTDEFILWMRRAHRQDIRWLIVSEVIKNAVKLGTRISKHYENNEIFRHVFDDVIPRAGGTWNNESLHHRRSAQGDTFGEGTYDFIGVGGALQSRHYDGIIQDDLVGKDAIESEIEMGKVIDYHKLLVGAFNPEADSSGRENDELIVGNRWAWNDLNSWVRVNEPYFSFTTHSALGGCCGLHPYGVPIYPEAFSVEKLEKWKKRLGTYHFSCQFLNMPINPAELKLNKKDLRYFEFVRAENESITDKKKRIAIRHHVHEGDVIKDVMPRTLRRYMIVDPNHAEQKGRCRHAITVTGVQDEPRRIYLLDVWARATSIETFINAIFIMAKQWKLTEVFLETIAAQRYLKYHLEYRQAVTDPASDDAYIKNISFKELKTPRTANAKQLRIESLIPIIERHELWVNTSGQDEFMEEVEAYPNGPLRDVLDTLGYGPQVWDFEPTEEEIEDFLNVGLSRWTKETRVYA